MVRTRRGVHDRVYLAGFHPSHVECPLAGKEPHLGSSLALTNPVTLLDAGAGSNPFVSGVHELGELVVGDHTIRHGETSSQEARALHPIIQ
jgi:hypothetical protein